MLLSLQAESKERKQVLVQGVLFNSQQNRSLPLVVDN